MPDFIILSFHNITVLRLAELFCGKHPRGCGTFVPQPRGFLKYNKVYY